MSEDTQTRLEKSMSGLGFIGGSRGDPQAEATKRIEQRLSRVESRCVDIARAVGVKDLRVGQCSFRPVAGAVDIPHLGVSLKNIIDAVPAEHQPGKAVTICLDGRSVALISIHAVG